MTLPSHPANAIGPLDVVEEIAPISSEQTNLISFGRLLQPFWDMSLAIEIRQAIKDDVETLADI